MRHVSPIAFLILLILLIPMRAHGQNQPTSTGRKFNPPITTIEITGNEPKTRAYQLIFAGGGGGSTIQLAKFHFATQSPYWVETPVMEAPTFENVTPIYASGGDFIACNYPPDSPPRATLTDPDGKQQEIAVTQNDETPGETGCWKVSAPVTQGMTFGLYTLTLDHPQGQLRHQWGIDYLACPWVTEAKYLDEKNQNVIGISLLVSGLAPGQNLTVHVLLMDERSTDKGTPITVIATRQITIGDGGDVMIDVKAARSAPYDLNLVQFMLLGPHGELYNERDLLFSFTEGEWSQFAQDYGIVLSVPDPKPKYGEIYYLVPRLVPNPICTQKLGDYAQAVPVGAGSIVLYGDYGDTSKQVSSIPAGDPVVVLEQRAALMQGHVVVWSRVHAESGVEGWTYGNQLQRIDLNMPPPIGSKFEIQQVGTSNGQPMDLVLRNTPNTNAEAITTLKPGSQVDLVKDLDLLPDWYYIQDQDGHLGYIPAATDYKTGEPSQLADPYLLTTFPLPWKPADISQIPPPSS